MGKLISLTERRGVRPRAKRLLFHINQKGKLQAPLKSLDFLNVVNIDSWVKLSSQIHFQKPEMIFIEADMQWAHPIQVIDELSRHLDCPMILVCNRKKPQKGLIKQACARGIFDVLFTPLLNDELLETLRVLLKLPSLRLGNR